MMERLQQPTLFELEQVIERGVQTFVEVGLALMEVRDRKLYEEAGYATFDQYCYGRWGFKYERGRQLIEAAQTAKVLAGDDGETPTNVGVVNEAQARAIAPLAKKDPEAARQVLRDVSAQNQHVTASRLREAVREHFTDGAEINDSVTEKERIQRHVETADAYPVFQKPDWKQYHVLEAREALSKLPEEERPKAVAIIDEPGIPPREALTMLKNITVREEPQRKEIYSLHKSDDIRDRNNVATTLAEMPPMPDPRMVVLYAVVRDLDKCIRVLPDDALAPRLRELRREINSIADGLSARKESA